MKIVVGIALLSGLFIGIAIAAIQSNGSSSTVSVTSADSKSEKFDPKDFTVEVLKSLPAEELAEMFPEKAEVILNPEAAENTVGKSKSSDDPEYLRAVLQKLGVDPPENATTKELQDMLAHVDDSNFSAK